MADSTCAIDGCTRPHDARGWCSMHYRRWRRNGDPLVTQRVEGDDERRFWSHVSKDGPVPDHAPHLGRCWQWTRATGAEGYGAFRVGGKTARAHRYAWLLSSGDAPPPILDHACNNRACVRPSHLRPATPLQNVTNRVSANRNSSTGARGVIRNADGTYSASVTTGGREVPLGVFETLSAASAAAAAKRSELWGEFAGL